MVITGAGGDFCAGADLTGGGAGGRGGISWRRCATSATSPWRLHRLPMPTIAKVRGVAVGAGCNMALGCDLIVASDNARFSEIFARRRSVDRLRWLVAAAADRRACIAPRNWPSFADIIDAAEAERIGLVNRVVPDAELDEFVDDVGEHGLPPVRRSRWR